MLTLLNNYWKRLVTDKKFTAYELEQRHRTLNVILGVVGICSILLALLDFYYGLWSIGIIIFLLAPTCLLSFNLNRKGRYFPAAVLVSCLILFVIDIDIFNSGGLSGDLGAVAFPVLVVISSLLIGKRGIYTFSCLSILSTFFLGALEILGFTPQRGTTDIGDVMTVAVLILGVSFLLWVIIDHAEKNLQRIKNSELMLQITYELTLEGLVKAVELRDQETEGHSQRVVGLSVALAKKLGLNDADILIIKRGALLHDIGKLAVPDGILHKPGKLDAEEWEIMKKHPAHARDILSTIPFLGPCIDIPYCHHENWDGSGYPRQLKGEEIPFFARIFTVADQWEALTSERVYRNAWPVEKVIGYVQENSGKIYDPCIAQVFLDMLNAEPGLYLRASEIMKVEGFSPAPG